MPHVKHAQLTEQRRGAKNVIASVGVGCALICAASPSFAGPLFGSSSYSSSLTLNGSPNGSFPVGAAYSDGDYYAGSGGSGYSPEQQFDSSGNLLNTASPTPGIDFRSIFTDSAGNVFARGFDSNEIYEQTTFATFVPYLALQGSIDAQEAIVLDPVSGLYVGNNNGTAQEWNGSGQLVKSFSLQGANSSGRQGRAIAVYDGALLNYFNGVLSAYSEADGQFLDSTILLGAATGTNAYFSESFANGYFFLFNTSVNGYQGFLLTADIPEPNGLVVVGPALIGMILVRRRGFGSKVA